ncbi:MAG TPA: hypothetical protein DD429_05400 [Clostridiaceae bacterium]|nr:hypothetical protein [Clostridiaceae bacterium]
MSLFGGVRRGVFTVPGDGCIDFKPLFKILEDNDYEGWFIVEAEQDPAKANPYLVQAGKIGEPQIIKVTSRDPEAPPISYVKVSGGIFLDMTIHDFDMVRYLSGSDVKEVYTNAAVLIDSAIGDAGDVDTAIITLKFKNGAIGVIDNSRKAAYGYDQRVEVFGSKGSVTVSNDTDSSAVLSTEDGVFSEKPKYFFLERYKDSFVEELREFFDAVKNDTDTPVSGMDGLKPVLIGLAAKKSYLENRPVKAEDIEL